MWLRQSTASQEISLGQFLDSTDGNTEENALTIANTDIKLRKGGTTTLANKNSGGATSISNGVYHATLDATDTNTLGLLEVYVHVAGALATKSSYMILPAATYDALVTNGLNDLSAAQVNAECDTALTDYDGPTNAEMNARTLVAANYFDPATDAVANVTLVGTTTTNTDMRGTDSAATAANLATVDTNVDAILVDTSTTIPAQITGLNDFDPVTDTVANVTLVATTTTNTDMRGTDGANTTTPPSAASISSTVWAETTRELTAGTNIVLAKGVGVTGFNDIAAIDVLNAGDIDGFTLEESQKLILASGVGTLSGAATTTITINAADGSKARLTATVDASGNRSAVIKDATG